MKVNQQSYRNLTHPCADSVPNFVSFNCLAGSSTRDISPVTAGLQRSPEGAIDKAAHFATAMFAMHLLLAAAAELDYSRFGAAQGSGAFSAKIHASTYLC